MILLFGTSISIFADKIFLAGTDRVVELDPVTEKRRLVSGPLMLASGFIAIDPKTGNYFTADQGDRAVYQINHLSGVVTTITGVGIGEGPLLGSRVYGIAAGLDGSLAVVDGSEGMNAVFTVNPSDGSRRILSAGSNPPYQRGTGPSFQTPYGIATEPSGNFVVTDLGRNAVIRVDRVTGDRTLVTGDQFGDNAGSGPELNRPDGIAVRSDGAIFVNGGAPGNQGFIRLIKVDPVSGLRTYITNLDAGTLRGMAVATNGLILSPTVSAVNGITYPGGKVLGYDPSNGKKTILTGEYNTWYASFLDNGEPIRNLEDFIYGKGPLFFNPIGIAVEKSGKIVVSDPGMHSVFTVDSSTGERTALPNSRRGTGPDISSPKGVALANDGSLIVADDHEKTIFRIDPATGNRSILSAGSNTSEQRGIGSNLSKAKGIAIESAGTILVADDGWQNPKILRIDPLTGNRSIVSSSSVGTGPKLSSPYGIAVEASGSILVTDPGISGSSVVRIDPVSGDRWVVSSSSSGTGLSISGIRGIALVGDGSILVTGNRALHKIDRNTGNRTELSSNWRGSGPAFVDPCGVSQGEAGKALVLDAYNGNLLEVDLASGNRTIVSTPKTGVGPNSVAAEFFTRQIEALVKMSAGRKMADGTFQLTLTGSPGLSYSLEQSTDLREWTVLTNIMTSAASTTVIDPAASRRVRTFYRARTSR